MGASYLIGSLLKAAKLLDLFSEESPKLRNIDIARKTGFNKSTVMRLLLSLEKAGYVEKDPLTGEYTIGMRLFEVGSKYLDRTDLHRQAMPILSELAGRCNETGYLAVLSGRAAVYLDRVESSKAIRTTSRVGSRIPLYCTAAGKAILAFQEEQMVQDILTHTEIRPFTPQTIVKVEKILKNLEAIRKLGYAIDNQEYEMEIMSVGAPVYDRNGKANASVSLVGPVWLMSGEKKELKLAQEVLEAAQQISRKMGFMPERKTYLY